MNEGSCGNGKIEDGEECDCGSISNCKDTDPCCDPLTCRLKIEADCTSGPCCDKCQVAPPIHYIEENERLTHEKTHIFQRSEVFFWKEVISMFHDQ